MKALVTGANGFIGLHLADHLEQSGWQVVRCQRSGARADVVADLATADPSLLAAATPAFDVVFHLAGRAHRRADPGAYERDNVEATSRTFEWARLANARRFVYVSTIRVLGDVSRHPFRIGDPRQPVDPYADSKARAELLLESVAGLGPAVTIVRPPLVYGPGVGANFLRLMKGALRGWPLPLGRATAPRSQVAVTNLVDLLLRCCTDDRGFRLLHVRDDRDYSVAELVQSLCAAGARRPRLWGVPRGIVRVALASIGQGALCTRLYSPAQIDDRATRSLLGWTPPVASTVALAQTVAWWQRTCS